jgi:hypothetical protein
MKLISTELEPAYNIITALHKHVPINNLNGKNGIPVKIRMGNQVLEHKIAIIKVENSNVPIGLSNEDLLRFGHCAAHWVDSLFEVLGSVDVNGFDYFGGACMTAVLLSAWQECLPNSDVAVVTAGDSVNDLFDVDKNAGCGVDGSRVQQLSTQVLLTFFLVVKLAKGLRNPPNPHKVIRPASNHILFFFFHWISVGSQRVNNPSMPLDRHHVLSVLQPEHLHRSRGP